MEKAIEEDVEEEKEKGKFLQEKEESIREIISGRKTCG